MNKDDTVFRDIPVGVLMIVVSLFFVQGLMYLAKSPSFLEVAGIYVCVIVIDILSRVGIALIIGKKIDKTDE